MKLSKIITKHLPSAISLLLIVNLALLVPSGALYSDFETADPSQMTSTSLDLEVSATPFDVTSLSPGDTATKQVLFTKAGNLPFAYSQQYIFESGDQTLCDALNVQVTYNYYNGVATQEFTKYSGPLKDFSFNLPADPDDPDALLPNARPYHSNVNYTANQHWYTYAVTLPSGADSALQNQSCSFHVESYAWQPELLAPLVGFWDLENTSHAISSGQWVPCSTISGYKYNDQQEGLENWEIVVHPTTASPAQTITLNSNNPDGETTMNLEADHTYLIEVEGTWLNQGTNRLVDADYWSGDNWATTGDFDTDDSRDPRQLDVVINDIDIDWMAYHSNHLYKNIYQGEGDPVTIRIFDEDQDPSPPGWYQDNSGSLTIRLYDVTGEIVSTNADGYYQAPQVCTTDDYQILEVPQTDWQQITPTGTYYHANLPLSGNESFDFVNQAIETHLVINEVYYDVDEGHGVDGNDPQSDEWVELYNPNNFAVNLKDWSLTDNGNEKSLSNRNVYIPAHGFGVIAKNAQTWTYWTIPSDAIKIELGGNLGNGLANSGDHLILKNSNGEEIDTVSWGTDTTAFNPSVPGVTEGHSIARSPLGYDTDIAADWTDLTTPNPGTNPHSHIHLSVEQTPDHELMLHFTNAVGFNHLRYSVSYQHEYETYSVDELIEGEVDKATGADALDVGPIYLGTCSTDGTVCTPHHDISAVKLNLMYKLDTQIIGTSTIPFTWQNEIYP